MKLFRRKRAQRQPNPRRIIFLRKRYLAIPGAILIICALCLAINLPTYVTASTTDRQLPIYCVQRDYKVCSLTFDAAWGNAILRHISNHIRHFALAGGSRGPRISWHEKSRHMENRHVPAFRFSFQFNLRPQKELTGITVPRSLPGYGRS